LFVKMPLSIPRFEDAELAARIQARWNHLTKPPGSLGQLEELVARYAMIRGDAMPDLAAKAMYVFCGDHGITEEGVSAFPSSITAQMVRNFLSGGAAINVLCRQYGIETAVVDCGVNAECEEGAIDCRIGRGTGNFARCPAMSREQAEQAIANGAALARTAARTYDVAGVGEMGIGNTTSASALLCVFGGLAPAAAVGRGAGLDDDGVARKARAIECALALHRPVASDPVGVLAAVGGFEIATMAGFLLGAAEARLPVMVDGFIASSAALAAVAIDPAVRPALLFAHCSAEQGHRTMLRTLGARPLFQLEMRLGEGTAAAIGIGLLESALKLYREMATFDDLA
jgi:nicotinate-nucleotide--dimethylbenzimidazole phosphoribosyltransferase